MASRSSKVETQFDRPLKRGSKGQDVEQLQKSLMELNVMRKGTATRYYGSITEQAVRTLEAKAKKEGFDFKVDGKLSTKEIETLRDLNLLTPPGTRAETGAGKAQTTVGSTSPAATVNTQGLRLPSTPVDDAPRDRFAPKARNIARGSEPDIRTLWNAPEKPPKESPTDRRRSRSISKAEADRNATQFDSGMISKSAAQVAYKKGVDPDLIKSIIRHESGNNNLAISYKTLKTGEKVPVAYGAMQLIPSTAASMGYTADSIHGNTPAEVNNNVTAGTTYFNGLLKRHKGNLPLALAAYNAGPGAVDNGKAFSYPETRAYVKRVMDTYQKETGIPVNEYYEKTMARFGAREKEPTKVAQKDSKQEDKKTTARRKRS